MAGEEIKFQAEVGKILEIVINSLYSNREIFLRELISNAADACDKLRYLALTVPELAEGGGDFKIEIGTDKKARTVTVSDNGIGMNREELIQNLGTIARSGTTEFLQSLSGDARKDAQLIGQFGVGFYACFSVADRVDVVSRKAGDDTAWRWSSDGKGAFEIEPSERERQGTSITVHLAKDQSEYLEEARIRHIVQQYSDHISIPIMLAGKDGESQQLNKGSALWTRAPKEVTEDQYREFYHHVAHAFDKPWLTLHNKAEGKVEYTNLLFIPSARPFDLMHPDRKHGVKLYVKRVFITDDCEGLMPRWLRFVQGVVDSQDLPLNVSREVLQHNVLVDRIRTALVKRIFTELKKKAEKAPEEFETFWENFGAVVKEGLYEPNDHRDDILAIARFRTTAGDATATLADYVGRMKEGQEEIFFISGEDMTALKSSPQLEGFRARGIEVLLLTDPIDEFWIPMVGKFQEKPLRSVTAGGFDLSKIKGEEKSEEAAPEKADDAAVAQLILAFKEALESAVRDVRATDRLTDSAVCLIAGEGDMDLNLERMLRRQGHMKVPTAARILEINPAHPLIKALAGMVGDLAKKPAIADAAHLLLDQARIVEGETLADPLGFSARLNAALTRSLAA